MSPKRSSGFKETSYELFIGALSVLALVNLALYYLIDNRVVEGVIVLIDGLLSLIFVADFLYRLMTAPSRGRYFVRAGWADLFSSLPFPWAKALRLVRVVHTGRRLDQHGSRRIVREFLGDRADSTLFVLLFIIILLVEFGGMGMVAIESGSPEANIRTPFDAIWYTFVTISTVGYGDRYPVTMGGRLIGLLIMAAGVGLFGTLTGYLARIFLSPRKRKTKKDAEADMPEAKLAELKQLLSAQQQACADLTAKIDELEQLLAGTIEERGLK